MKPPRRAPRLTEIATACQFILARHRAGLLHFGSPMPLKEGSSEEIIAENIAELRDAGHPEGQAVAIAEKEADKARDAAEPATAAGVLYLSPAGRVLLLKRRAEASHGGTWANPGGGIEDGESPIEAAIRESREEVGHVPQAEAVALMQSGCFQVFLCTEPEFQPVLNNEHMGYGWAPVGDLPQPLHPGVEDQIKAALDRMKPAAQDATAEDKGVVDVNGWTEIQNNPISRVGVFPYRGSQIPGAPDPDAIYMVYRPAEELSHPDCIASFRLLPWIDNHAMLGDPKQNAALTPAEKKGIQGVIGEQVYFDPDAFEAGGLFGNIKVLSQTLANLIASGKRELSAGYRLRYEHAPGEFMGQRYEYVQRDIRGNHLALVKEGRMGPEVSVQDSSTDIDQFTFTIDSKDIDMAEEVKKDGDASGMSLEDALKVVTQAMPAIQTLLGAAAGNPLPAPAADADEPPKKDDKSDKEGDGEGGEKKEEKKEGEGMDAKPAVTLKSLMAEVSARDALAARLSKHIGTFEHAAMDTAEVAAYGCEKLGLKVPKGQENAAIEGYLKAATAPSDKPVATAHDAKTTKGDTFLSRHLNRKEA